MDMKRFLKDCVTCPDGESGDVGRIFLILGALAFLGMSIYHLWKHGQFDPIGFGGGYGGLMTGACAGIKLKEKSEPTGD